MDVQATIQFNVAPVVVIWHIDDKCHSRIFRSVDLAHVFVTENSLWNDGACIHDEQGVALACPVAPADALQVDVK